MKTASIGFTRDDGDFQLLATLNNNDDLIPQADFDRLTEYLRGYLGAVAFEDCEILNRQDAPDYITIDEEF